MRIPRYAIGAILVGCILAGSFGAPVRALAQDASAWDGDKRSAARLVAGARRTENGAAILRGGIEIRLAPGWKTYWRYPGDSGVPPRFDFSRSDNVATLDVLWPAPQRFADEEGNSIGYKGDVILPLRIVAKDAGKPALLRLKLDYAICEKLCVPAEASAELSISGAATAFDARISAAEDQVPKRVPQRVPNDASSTTLAIRAVRQEDAAPHPRVVVDVAAPAAEPVVLFAEGPTAEWALPLPQEVPGAPPGLRRFAFDLDGYPPGTKPDGATLRLTAVAGGHAIEVSTAPLKGAQSD
jgi:DsbC/DsbD-like thiol-disulfide interchange protein